MKNLKSLGSAKVIAAFSGLLTVGIIAGCDKDDKPEEPTPASLQNFTIVNMVASDASITAGRIDPKLINAWGISFSAGGTPWISSTGDHSTAVYNGTTGAQQLAAVTIPTHGATTGGLPTGQVSNASAGFRLTSNNNPARFIFAGLDGVISGWNGGAAAISMVDRSGTSVYTGLAIGAVGVDSFIYATDFKSGKVDVFNKTWILQTSTFTDPGLPAGYYPFNIQNIANKLYVTYAQREASGEEKKGAGLGIVSVFNTDGSFIKRMITGGQLNAPWGIAQAPPNWLTNATGSTVTLVGNFGDGHINAYDSASNKWLGTLQTNGAVLKIDGLWGISFKPATATALNGDWLYFAAGPADETKGVFGYVTK